MRILNQSSRLPQSSTGGQHPGQGDGGARVIRRAVPGTFRRIPIHATNVVMHTIKIVMGTIRSSSASLCSNERVWAAGGAGQVHARRAARAAERGQHTCVAGAADGRAEDVLRGVPGTNQKNKSLSPSRSVAKALLGWVELSFGDMWVLSHAPWSAPVSAFAFPGDVVAEGFQPRRTSSTGLRTICTAPVARAALWELKVVFDNGL